MNSGKILFVSHDANRAGAQLLLLQLLKILKNRGVPMHLLLLKEGVIEDDFREVVTVTRVPDQSEYVFNPTVDKVLQTFGVLSYFSRRTADKQKEWLQHELEKQDIGLVFVNSIANAGFYRESLEFLHDLPVVLFAHELGMSASNFTKRDDLEFLLRKSNHLIAVAQAVADFYIKEFRFPDKEVSILTLIDHDFIDRNLANAKKDFLTRNFNIPADAIIIGGCGNAEWRKGNDVFSLIARAVISQTSPLPVYFIWVGAGPSQDIYELLKDDIGKMGLQDRILLIPPTSKALDYIARFDIMLLSSREDPYPLVVMESALNETPIVCFDGAGGAIELVEDDAGAVVPYMDIPAATDALIRFIIDPQLRQEMGRKARLKVLERHKTGLSVEKIMSVIQNYLTLPLSEKL